MQRSIRIHAAIVFVVAGVSAAACGHKKNEQSAAGNVALPSSPQPSAIAPAAYSTPTTGIDSTKAKPKHHSKLKGTAAGVAGHTVSHSAAGAATGAAGQHERNKQKK